MVNLTVALRLHIRRIVIALAKVIRPGHFLIHRGAAEPRHLAELVVIIDIDRRGLPVFGVLCQLGVALRLARCTATQSLSQQVWRLALPRRFPDASTGALLTLTIPASPWLPLLPYINLWCRLIDR